jgi:hypothetical protein
VRVFVQHARRGQRRGREQRQALHGLRERDQVERCELHALPAEQLQVRQIARQGLRLARDIGDQPGPRCRQRLPHRRGQPAARWIDDQHIDLAAHAGGLRQKLLRGLRPCLDAQPLGGGGLGQAGERRREALHGADPRAARREPQRERAGAGVQLEHTAALERAQARAQRALQPRVQLERLFRMHLREGAVCGVVPGLRRTEAMPRQGGAAQHTQPLTQQLHRARLAYARRQADQAWHLLPDALRAALQGSLGDLTLRDQTQEHALIRAA